MSTTEPYRLGTLLPLQNHGFTWFWDTKTVSDMDNITSRGLPFIVEYLLDGQCSRTDTILEYKISCTGKSTQLTLTWTPVSKNSMPTQACSGNVEDKPRRGYKKKTPSDKKRDSVRKQNFIEKKKKTIKQTIDSSKVCDISKPNKVDVKSTGPRTRSRAKLTEGKDSVIIASSDTPELKRTFASESDSANLFYSPISIGSIEETGRLDTSWDPDLENQPPWSVKFEENQATELLECDEISNSSTPENIHSDNNSDMNKSISENEYDSCGSEDPYDSLLDKLKQLEVCFNDHFSKT